MRPKQTRQVLDLVRVLAERGLAVVLISHNLHDIFEVADRITVLRLGRNIAVYERAVTTQQEVVSAITAGVPTKVVTERLGHHSPAFTLKYYAHVTPGMQAEAAATVAALIDGVAAVVA